MKRKLFAVLLIFVLIFQGSSFASTRITIVRPQALSAQKKGEWKQDNTGWWYLYEDGTYPTSCWEWIDGDGNGMMECYYFSETGYCVLGGIVDGYTVDQDGRWVVDGVIQEKPASSGTHTLSLEFRNEGGKEFRRQSNNYRVQNIQGQ